MPHIGTEGQDEVIDIEVLRIPALESSTNEGEAQVVNTRGRMTSPGSPPELFAYTNKGMMNHGYREGLSLVSQKEPLTGWTFEDAITSSGIALQGADGTGMHRHVAGLVEFTIADMEQTGYQIDILTLESERLRDS